MNEAMEFYYRLRDQLQASVPAQVLRRLTRNLRHYLPTGLYTRSLLIIILPMLLLQGVVAAVFMERHWQLVTERLSAAVTRDISAIISLLETKTTPEEQARIIAIANADLELNVFVEPLQALPEARPKPFLSILDSTLSSQIERQIDRPFWLDTYGNGSLVEIRILLDDKTLRIFTRRNQTYASNTHIFLVWMVAASLVLIGIAILFLRGQIKPILTLAQAAEAFGRGQKNVVYSPRGAIEIRRAGLAFILMRERIERQIEQRTTMLNGVSHDLRTILTRFKLQLALASNNPDLEGLDKDVDDMQSMLEAYLAFAQNDTEEAVDELELQPVFDKLAYEFEMHGKGLTVDLAGVDSLIVRPGAFTRVINNIAGNALRYADQLDVKMVSAPKSYMLIFDDNGPGVPEDSREDVFKPFLRLDEARNLNASGTGLGLSIVRDIVRSHGGDVSLSDSPLGGLRVIIKLPN
jgi:two-component system osmolarity sensor histidine kinase EnvZ